MKYIKTYEKYVSVKPDFIEGDYAICVDNKDQEHNIDIGQKYLIKQIYLNDVGHYMCRIDTPNTPGLYCFRFKSEQEVNQDKYNL
jgi:hypothetical protein